MTELQEGLQFFASEYVWRLHERVGDTAVALGNQWLIHTLPQFGGEYLHWRLVSDDWIHSMMERYKR